MNREGAFVHSTVYRQEPGGGMMTISRAVRGEASGGAGETTRPFSLILTATGTGTASAKIENLLFVTSFGVIHRTDDPAFYEVAVVSGDILWAKVDTTDWSIYGLFIGEPVEADTDNGTYHFMPLYIFGGDPGEPVTTALDIRFAAPPVWS